MDITVAIMAGGRGERFWPKSRTNLPKQFLSLTDDGKTMLQLTVERVSSLADITRTFILTNKDYTKLVEKQLPNLPPENILCEPVARNTAPCIAMAAAAIQKKYGNSIMIVLPSDHLIADVNKFIETLKSAIDIAKKGESLITLGITPEYAETGYGYINFDNSKATEGAYNVVKFVEKPDVKTAQKYIEEGTYLWNSGMFVWQTDVILNNFKKFTPKIYAACLKIEKAYLTNKFDEVVSVEFPKMPSISVDYAIMEKAPSILTIPSSFGWDDVGSWLALERFNKLDGNKNVIHGNVVSINTKNSTIVGKKKLIATVGLDNIIVVDTDDAILICSKDSAQDVKKVIAKLKEDLKINYL